MWRFNINQEWHHIGFGSYTSSPAHQHRRDRHITCLTYFWHLCYLCLSLPVQISRLQAASERALSNAFFQPWLRQANLIPKCCRKRNSVCFLHLPHSAPTFQLTNWAHNAALPHFAIRNFWPRGENPNLTYGEILCHNKRKGINFWNRQLLTSYFQAEAPATTSPSFSASSARFLTWKSGARA